MIQAMRIVDVIGMVIMVGLIVRFGTGFAAAVNGVGSATSNVIHQLTMPEVTA